MHFKQQLAEAASIQCAAKQVFLIDVACSNITATVHTLEQLR